MAIQNSGRDKHVLSGCRLTDLAIDSHWSHVTGQQSHQHSRDANGGVENVVPVLGKQVES